MEDLKKINLKTLSQFRENNRLEAKLAKEALPNSIWETYSSFANTQGGVIILGIKEKSNHSFEVSGVDSPEKLISDFWNTMNNRNKISENILTDSDVFESKIDGKKIICIRVPRADRTSKPVYVGTDFFSGTFRRNGDGDYHCSREEVLAMVRDNAIQTQDSKLLTDFGMDVFNKETVAHYKNRFMTAHPHHVWENLSQDDFLVKLGAAARNKEDGKFYPTAAGLLMFGDEYNIVREFGNYFLDYREEYDPSTRWSDRLISSSGEWSGNLFDFFFNVCGKLVSNIKVPFSLNGVVRVDDTPAHAALREAFANALIHADYYGRRGIVIVKNPKYISISNPGTFRVSPEEAMSGGLSDPRNGTIIKLFNLINIGERAGSGLPWIYSAWNGEILKRPELFETFDPDRIELRFEVISGFNQDENEPQNAGDDPQSEPQNVVGAPQNEPQNVGDDPQNEPQNVTGDPQNDSQKIRASQILDLIKENQNITRKEIAAKLNFSVATIRRELIKMKDVVSYVGSSKAGHWEIKDE